MLMLRLGGQNEVMVVNPIAKIRAFWQQLRIRTKLSIAFSLITIFSIAVTTESLMQPYEQAMQANVVERNTNLAEQMVHEMTWRFGEKQRMLEVVAQSSTLQSMDPARQQVVLQQMVAQYPDLQLAVVADRAGQQTARWDGQPADAAIQYNDRQYFRELLRTGQTPAAEVLRSRSTQKLGIVMASPIKNERQEVIGALIISLELEKLVHWVEESRFGNSGYAYVTNQKGEVIIHPDIGLVEHGMDRSGLPPVAAGLAGQNGWLVYTHGGEPLLTVYRYIPQTKMVIVVQQPVEEAMAEVQAIKQKSIFVVALLLLLAVLLGLGLADELSWPLARIAAAARRLGANEQPVQLAVTGQDEVGQLAQAFNDMSEQLLRRSEALRASEAQYHSLVDNIHLAIFRTADVTDGQVLQGNPAMAEMFGYPDASALQGARLREFYLDPAEWQALLDLVRTNGVAKLQESLLLRRDGTPFWCSLTVTLQRNEQGAVWLDGVIADVSERRDALRLLELAHEELEEKVALRTQELEAVNDELRKLTQVDGLTGLANRRYFDEFLQQLCQVPKGQVGLVMLDVDYFKAYNDNYGHLAGDDCLRQIARLLQAVVAAEGGLAARYGGEEFAVVLPSCSARQLERITAAIEAQLALLDLPHQYSAVSQRVTVSQGATCLPVATAAKPQVLIETADQALYQAKHQGRNQTVIA